MKKKFLAGLAALVFMLGMVGMAQALTMAEVVAVDNVIGMADLGNSGEATELEWVNQTLVALGLGDGYNFVFKDDFDTDAERVLDWNQITDVISGRVYAYDMGADASEYFMIKTGTGTDDPVYDHFLFDNLDSLRYAVIDLDDFDEIEIKNIGKVSHIAGIDGAQPVPEPATLMLFGSGLLGVGWFGRRKKV